jgi:hypothetical protein
MFIRLFDGGDLKVQIIYRLLRNYNVIIISELMKEVEGWIIADRNYGNSLQVQRITGNLILCSRLYGRDFNRNRVYINQERFL